MLSAIDRSILEILSAIVFAIVNRPHEVKIEAGSDDTGAIFEVRLDKSESRRLIGRGGDTARAIRTIALGVAAKHKRKCTVKFVVEDAEVTE